MRKSILPIFAVGFAFAALLALSSCFSEDPIGTPATELKFKTIADSLGGAGYDKIEISVTRTDGSDSLSVYKGVLPSDGAAPHIQVPEGFGDSYRIVVTATKLSDAGLVFHKTYTITDGLIAGKAIVVVPGTGNPDPNTVPAPTGVAIQPGSLDLLDGGKDSSRLVAKVLPFPAAAQRVAWSSSNPAVASVDSTGWVRSGTEGKATITAAAAADVSKSSSIEVTVSKPVKADKLELQDTLTVYTGMPGTAVNAKLYPAGIPPLLNWHSSEDAKAVVSSDGKVTGLKAGLVEVWAEYKGDAAIADTCKVTVVYDPPVLDVGDAVSVEVGATVEFPIKVSQLFGGVVQFRWSLDGDTLWDSTSASIPAALSRKYPAAGDFLARFSVKDLEGNIGTAQRLVRVGSNKPLVVIESPKDGAYVNTNPVTVAYKVNGTSFTRKVTLPREGLDTIAIDTTVNGVPGSASIKVILDTKAPDVVITSPLEGIFTNKKAIAVAWSVDGKSQSHRLLDTLKTEGQNSIIRDSVDAAGNRGVDTVLVTLDTKNPNVVISSPAPGTVTNQDKIAVVWSVDGQDQKKELSDSLPADGDFEIVRKFKDEAGNEGSDTVKVTRNKKAAQVRITSPLPGSYTNKTSIDVTWSVDSVNQTTKLTEALTVEGENTIFREGANALGNKGSTSVSVIRDTKVPVIKITSPVNGAIVAANPVTVTWTIDSVSQSTQTTETMAAGDGEKSITRSFIDLAGNPGTQTINVILDLLKPLAPVMNATGTTASPTNAASVTWKWAPGGNGNGTYRYWLDNPAVPASPTLAASPTATISTALADGTHTLYAQESDAQGNWSPSGSHPIVVDKTGPSVAIDQAAQTVTAPAFTISATVSDPVAVVSVEVTGASAGNGAMTLAAGKYSKAVTLAAGANTLSVTAKDNLGNPKVATVVITYDKPSVTITFPPDGYVTSNGAMTLKWDYKVGSTVTSKTQNVNLGDGTLLLPIKELNADEKSVTIFVMSKIVFVRKGVVGGDGTSWDKAYGEVYAALGSARGSTSGNQLWISAGTYTGNPSTFPSFKLPAGVSLYGGFASTGMPYSEEDRNFNSGKTTLRNTGTVQGYLLDVALTGTNVVDGIAFMTDYHNGFVTTDGSGSLTLSRCTFTNTNAEPDYFMLKLTGNVTVDSCTLISVHTAKHFIQGTDATVVVKNKTMIIDGEATGIMYLNNSSLSMTNSTVSNNFFYHSPGVKPSLGYISPTSTLTVTAPNTSPDVAALNKP